MSQFDILLSESERILKDRRRLIFTIICIVVAIHLLGGLIATVIVVARYLAPPPATFVVKKDIRLPAQERQHRINMAAFDALTPKPSFTDRLLSARPTQFSLPDLPKLPIDQMIPLNPSEIVSDQVTSLVGAAGLGAGGQGGGSGLGGLGSGFSFLGIQSSGRRILLLFDISKSVVSKAAKSGMPITKIKDETLHLIDKLPSTSRFGIIQFSQNYQLFRPELVPANDANRDAVREWVKNEWVETGSLPARGNVVRNPEGLLGVLQRAAQLQPDVIFLISDASFQRGLENIPWEEIEKTVRDLFLSANEVPINFIGFEMKASDKRAIGSIVRKTGGRLREIK